MKPFQKESLSNPETPFFHAIDQIIQNSTVENKKGRFKTVNELRHALSDAIEKLEKKSAASGPAKSQYFSILHNPKWIWSGVILAVVLVAAMTVWHLMGEPGKSHQVSTTTSELTKTDSALQKKEPFNDQLIASDPPQQTILAEDGATMVFVPGGMVSFMESSGTLSKRSVKVDPFYMDETQVTNHQFVEFLNQNLLEVRVDKRVVRSDEEIWLFLGEVIEGYNPIIYNKGRFKVSNANFASFPVLRVTGFGASAYANFYGRRLPTVSEWVYTVKNGALPQKNSSPTASVPATGTPMDRMMGSWTMNDWSEGKQDSGRTSAPQALEALQKLEPVLSSQPNAFGIRGMDNDFGEWALLLTGATSRDEKTDQEYVILGGIEGIAEKESSILSLVSRHPWEAFEEIGFRSARSVKIQSADHE